MLQIKSDLHNRAESFLFGATSSLILRDAKKASENAAQNKIASK